MTGQSVPRCSLISAVLSPRSRNCDLAPGPWICFLVKRLQPFKPPPSKAAPGPMPGPARTQRHAQSTCSWHPRCPSRGGISRTGEPGLGSSPEWAPPRGRHPGVSPPRLPGHTAPHPCSTGGFLFLVKDKIRVTPTPIPTSSHKHNREMPVTHTPS